MSASDLQTLANIIDPESFSDHAMAWRAGPGDFPSNWERRRAAAFRKAEQIIALFGGIE